MTKQPFNEAVLEFLRKYELTTPNIEGDAINCSFYFSARNFAEQYKDKLRGIAESEPVAWQAFLFDEWTMIGETAKFHGNYKIRPLYVHPPTTKPDDDKYIMALAGIIDNLQDPYKGDLSSADESVHVAIKIAKGAIGENATEDKKASPDDGCYISRDKLEHVRSYIGYCKQECYQAFGETALAIIDSALGEK